MQNTIDNIDENKLTTIVERARHNYKKKSQLGFLLTQTRHDAIRAFCKKRNVAIGDFLNSLLDEFFPK